jgi:hypothetical protein
MGNRAVIVFKIKYDNELELSPQVYLHWNGGPESVMAFLHEMERRGYTRDDYASARLCQVVGEFFRGVGECVSKDEGLSLGLYPPPKDLKPETLKQIDHGDNGVYVVEVVNEKFVVENTCMGKITRKNLKALLKKQGKGYREGFQDKPQRQYNSILEFYLEQETLLKKQA